MSHDLLVQMAYFENIRQADQKLEIRGKKELTLFRGTSH